MSHRSAFDLQVNGRLVWKRSWCHQVIKYIWCLKHLKKRQNIYSHLLSHSSALASCFEHACTP